MLYSFFQVNYILKYIKFKSFKVMGNKVARMCGQTDFFQHLLENHGEEFINLILSQKGKIMLQQKFIEVMTKFKEFVLTFQNRVNSIVDGKIKEITESFEKIKLKVDSVIPGGIQKLQQKKGSNIYQFSGFNELIKKIDQIRDQTLQKMHEKKTSVQQELIQNKNNLHNQIQQQRPKVPIYENLPHKVRVKILLKGEKKFEKHIEEYMSKNQKQWDKKFDLNFSQFDTYLNKINPHIGLTDMVSNALQDMAKNLFGGGKFSSYFDKVF